MTKKEKELLSSIVDDVENSDDKIDSLERLFSEVRKMLNR